MAWADLTPTEQEEVRTFLRNYRAAMADTVRGLRIQSLLAQSYADSIASLWEEIGSNETIEDGSGLAGADLSMTKAEFQPMFIWTTNLLAAVYAIAGGQNATAWVTRATVDAYGVRLAGPTNIG